jgi:hypothetical protein
MSALPSLAAGELEGEARKREALALLADRRRALIRRASRELLEHLLLTATATADDLRELVPLPDGINPKVFGAVFAGLAEEKLIHQIGFEQSRRPLAHRRPVGVWHLADRDTALAWLAAHPDLPDPESDKPPTLFD